MRPTFFVFCEGETEEAYVKYLRSRYRLPIEIDATVAGTEISDRHIRKYKRDRMTTPTDRDYAMYDLDRGDIADRLKSLTGATVIGSNPCIEIWFLLHVLDRKSEISSSDCCKALKSRVPTYRKGRVLCRELLSLLESNATVAIRRAGMLRHGDNPSTEIPALIRDLEEEAARK